MPQTRIDTRRGWLPAASRPALLQAVQDALVDAFRIPPGDRSILLHEHEADAFLVPEGAGAGFVVVETVLIMGRTIEAKRRFYRAVVDALDAFGVPAGDVRVILVEPTAENWGVGGVPASEIDLGFPIEV